MKCKICGGEFNEANFERCPFCLTPVNNTLEIVDNFFEQNESRNKVKKDELENINELAKVTSYEEKYDIQKNNNEMIEINAQKKYEIPNIILQQMDSLSIKAKNILTKNGIITFKDLLNYLKNNNVSSLQCREIDIEGEISNIISTILCDDYTSLYHEVTTLTSKKCETVEESVIFAIENGIQPNIPINRILDMSTRTYNVCCKNNANDMLSIALLSQEGKMKKIRGAGTKFLDNSPPFLE